MSNRGGSGTEGRRGHLHSTAGVAPPALGPPTCSQSRSRGACPEPGVVLGGSTQSHSSDCEPRAEGRVLMPQIPPCPCLPGSGCEADCRGQSPQTPSTRGRCHLRGDSEEGDGQGKCQGTRCLHSPWFLFREGGGPRETGWREGGCLPDESQEGIGLLGAAPVGDPGGLRAGSLIRAQGALARDRVSPVGPP